MRSATPSIVAILTLALGIGATTAIYTVLDSVALRPLPYSDAGQLVSVLHPATVPGNGESKWGMSAGGYFAFKGENRSFEDLGSCRASTVILCNGSDAELAQAGEITASVFTTLRAHAAVGRLIGVSEDTPGAPLVVVLDAEF